MIRLILPEMDRSDSSRGEQHVVFLLSTEYRVALTETSDLREKLSNSEKQLDIERGQSEYWQLCSIKSTT